MTNDTNKTTPSPDETLKLDENAGSEPNLPVGNPLDPSDNRHITQEDIDNEQKYKEALTERD